MKQRFVRALATMVALGSVVQPAMAQQTRCIDQRALSDAFVYAAPPLYTAFQNRCSKVLATDGFAAREGARWVGRYAALHAESWPGARQVIMQFAAKGKKGGDIEEMNDMLSGLPDEAVQPFVDAMITQEIAKKIDAPACGKIERMLEVLAPLPPENTGKLLATLFDFAKVKDPTVCPYRPD